MFTQCPNCQTVFRVTATMLKAAQGRVRCGRCAFVFNALTFLREPDEAAADERRGESKSGAAKVAGSAAAAATAGQQGQPKKRPADEEMRFDDNTGLDDDDDDDDDDEDEDEGEDEDEDEGEDDADDGDGEDEDDMGDEAEERESEIVDEIQVAEEIELAGDAVEEGEAEDIPESELEFTADDLSKVFVLESAPTLPRPTGHEPADAAPDHTRDTTDTVDSTDDDETGQHEILDIEVAATTSSEEITLEGDSVVLEEFALEEEDPGADAAPFGEGDADAAPPPLATSTTPVAKKVSPTREAIDAEVQREIEAAFADDPGTRAEFILPSGKRMEIGGGAAPVETGVPADDEVSDPHEELAAQQQRQRRVMLGWSVASGVLAFTLVLQLIHFNRHSLVRNAAIGPALAGVYGTFGGELTPDWNLQAYELRQYGAAADADAQGTLRVRASLLNGAVHAQPYPVLRLTLQDRFGGQVGRRDLQPREYLHTAPSRNALIGAGQRIDADIAIMDPGNDAVGFEIDVCLPASAQGLACAGEAGRNAG